MIYDHGVLDAKEVAGILGAFDDQEHSIEWMFRDDENGIRFIYYSKWIDSVDTELNKITIGIFKKFCDKNGISVEDVYMARLTIMTQSKDAKVVYPEDGYPNPENVFIYFVSSSDRPITVNGQPVAAIAGGCLSVTGKDKYSFTVPDNDNFFIVAEVQYR